MLKKSIKKTFAVALITSLTWTAAQAAQEDVELQEGPCNKILDICKDFIKKSKEKKSLYRDCMQPLLNDEKVDGISIDPEVLKACKAKKSELRQKK